MTYAKRLTEFQRVTGHKPGEMNKRPSIEDAINQLAKQVGKHAATPDGGIIDGVPFGILATPLCDEDEVYVVSGDSVAKVSLEPASQSAGPGRCNRLTRAVALGDPTPCKLPANHEGPHGP